VVAFLHCGFVVNMGNSDDTCIAEFGCNYNSVFRLPKVSCNVRFDHLTEGGYRFHSAFTIWCLNSPMHSLF
jgi:hypothetical protein